MPSRCFFRIVFISAKIFLSDSDNIDHIWPFNFHIPGQNLYPGKVSSFCSCEVGGIARLNFIVLESPDLEQLPWKEPEAICQ